MKNKLNLDLIKYVSKEAIAHIGYLIDKECPSKYGDNACGNDEDENCSECWSRFIEEERNKKIPTGAKKPVYHIYYKDDTLPLEFVTRYFGNIEPEDCQQNTKGAYFDFEHLTLIFFKSSLHGDKISGRRCNGVFIQTGLDIDEMGYYHLFNMVDVRSPFNGFIKTINNNGVITGVL